MKKLSSILLVVMLIFAAPQFVAAQDADNTEQTDDSKKNSKKSKKEKAPKEKKSKKEKKAKAPKEGKEDAATTSSSKQKKGKAYLAEMEAQVAQFQRDLATMEEEKSKLEQKVTGLLEDSYAMKEELAEAKEAAKNGGAAAAEGSTTTEGLSFKVQLGAYSDIDLNDFLTSAKLLQAEPEGGLNKYTIGYFGDLDIAQAFADALEQLGIRDAWIVPYKDGGRISDEEAEQILGVSIRPE